jgi:hypothetical protein
MTEPIGPADETGEQGDSRRPTSEETPSERRPRLLVRIFGLALIIFSVVVATYLVVAYFAVESGRALRTEQETTARNEQINRQIELAREDLAEGSDNLALTRLDWVLTQDPDNADARALREEAANYVPEPTAAPTEPPTASPTGEATDDPATAEAALPELQALRRLVAAERWDEALPLLLTFQQQHPDYERVETDQLLYDTYVALGLSYVNTDKIELGLNYFALAERLGNLPQEALDYRVWADLYFEAVAYSGVNWGIAGDYWRDLCAAAPFFQDSCARLDTALVGYGDQLAYNLDWCPALSIYQEAWNRRPSQQLDAKVGQARAGCASATAVPISGTNPLSGTAPITGTNPLTPAEPGG